MNVRAFRISAILLSASLAACGGGTNTVPTQGNAGLPQSGSFQVPVANKSTASGERSSTVNDQTVYTLGDGTTNAALVSDMRFGSDGKLYYSAMGQFPSSGYPVTGEIGTFDLTTHAQSYQVVPYSPGFVDETSDGSVWVEEFNNASTHPTIDRYAGINGVDTQISIPQSYPWNGFGNGIDGGIAVGPNGRVWFGSNNSSQIGEIDPATNAVTLYNLITPTDPWGPTPQFMMLGSDNHIWVTDEYNDGVYRITSGGPAVGTYTFSQLPQGVWSSTNQVFLQGIVEGRDKKIYTGDPYPFAGGSLDEAPIARSTNFASLALPSIGIDPYVLTSVPGKIYFDEIHFGSLGIYNTVTKHVVILPLSTFVQSGIVTDSSGTPWIGCSTAQGVACIEQVKLTAKWALFPGTSLTLYTQDPSGNALPPGLIGIGETGNSGPFTVISSNSSVCTANFIPGYDHNIQVNPVTAGTCTLSITDLHSRTVAVSVTVMNGSSFPQSRIRSSTLMQMRQAVHPRPI